MKLTTRELTIFAMLGGVMYASKMIMEFAPNIHLLGVFTIAFTVVYRKKALYPIYIYVFLLGLLNGFASWWIPHLYVWTILWAVVMLLPQKMFPKKASWMYMIVCALHGMLYGILYAPSQAILYGLSFKATISWIIAGFPFDVIHGASNFFCAVLVVPIVKTLRLAERTMENR